MDSDLTLGDMEYLARVARGLRPEAIKTAVIDETMARSTMTPEGWDVLVADRERIRELVDDSSPIRRPRSIPQGRPWIS